MSETHGHASLDKMHSVRVPEKLKAILLSLSPSQVSALNDELRKVIARHAHLSKFDPEDYLSE